MKFEQIKYIYNYILVYILFYSLEISSCVNTLSKKDINEKYEKSLTNQNKVYFLNSKNFVAEFRNIKIMFDSILYPEFKVYMNKYKSNSISYQRKLYLKIKIKSFDELNKKSSLSEAIIELLNNEIFKIYLKNETRTQQQLRSYDLAIFSREFNRILKKAYNNFTNEKIFVQAFQDYTKIMQLILGKNFIEFDDFLDLTEKGIGRFLYLIKKIYLLLVNGNKTNLFLKYKNDEEKNYINNILNRFINVLINIIYSIIDYQKNDEKLVVKNCSKGYKDLCGILKKIFLDSNNKYLNHDLNFYFLIDKNYKLLFDLRNSIKFLEIHFSLIKNLLTLNFSNIKKFKNFERNILSEYPYTIMFLDFLYPNYNSGFFILPSDEFENDLCFN